MLRTEWKIRTIRRGDLRSPVFICYELTGDRIFSLPCKGCGSPVETSAFNAEAPTEPAGETVGCRRQLGGIIRLILYEFIKIPQSFFCSKKTTAPFTREPLTGEHSSPLRYDINFRPHKSQLHSPHSSLLTFSACNKMCRGNI